MIDAHCHLDFEAFDSDREHVADARDEHGVGIDGFIVPGTRPVLFGKLAGVARCHVAVGVHPAYLDEMITAEHLADAAERTGAIAIGEFGLDRRLRERFPPERQQGYARIQLTVAEALSLPVILHVVREHGAMLEMLEDFPDTRGLVHSFSGSAEVARDYVRRGFSLSFSPAVLNEKSKAREVVREVPEEHLLIETDAPDQGPSERNEPALLFQVRDEVARLRGVSPEEIARVTAANARGLFSLPG